MKMEWVRFAVAFRIALAVGSLSVGVNAAAQSCTAAPSEALNLALAGAGTTQLSWLPPADPGGTETVVYDILRSPTPNGFLSGYCVVSGVAVLNASDAAVPTPIVYYLVRAKNGCGGSLGADSSATPRSGANCVFSNGGACFYDNECSGGGCCSGFCRDLSNDPDHCGGCANGCSAAHMASRTCSGGVCNGTCAAGFSNCDANLLTDGCECGGNICCSGACEPHHVNGLGQSFEDCAALGVPGSASTYSYTMATEARAAWSFAGSDNDCTCGAPNASCVSRSIGGASSGYCAVWTYTSATAGHVFLNSANGNCLCPTTFDPTWN
jgi:hypothetical protein